MLYGLEGGVYLRNGWGIDVGKRGIDGVGCMGGCILCGVYG